MNKLNVDYFLKRIVRSKDFEEYMKANSDLLWFLNHRWTLATNEYTASVQKVVELLSLR